VVIDRVAMMDDVVARAMAPWRLSAWMLSLVATVAFGLSAIGLFSLVSLDAASRRHEFAIRLALGASPREIVRTATSVAARAVAVGAVLGLAGAVAGTRAIRSVLAEVGSLDGLRWSGVLLLIAAVAMAASYLPARRAGAIDPMALLRRD
jgi:ABC-type antimicrobial peptide transport system permease subunit